ncbi:hypothetical protein POG22_07340 [Geitlerinema sp. CS-897]|nr:hypothetical protein [Geitlerinema sp. CS-897]
MLTLSFGTSGAIVLASLAKLPRLRSYPIGQLPRIPQLENLKSFSHF